MVIGGEVRLGFDSYVGYQPEPTFGAGTATATNFIEFNSANIKAAQDEILISGINTTRTYFKRTYGNKSVAGPIEYPLSPEDGIGLIKHALGGTSTVSTIGANLAFNHTFTPGDNNSWPGSQASLRVSIRKGENHVFDYFGCRVNRWTLRAAINQPVISTMEFVAKDMSVGAAVTPAYTSLIPFIFVDGSYLEGNTTTALTTTSGLQYITGFELVVDNGLVSDDNVRSLGSRTVMDLPPGNFRNVTLNITQRFDTTTALTNWLTAAQRMVQIRLDTGVTIGAAGTNYAMIIDLPKVYYNGDDPIIPGPGVLTYTIPLRAIGNAVTSAAYDIQVQVTNLTTGY
jgi:hypothetical protein